MKKKKKKIVIMNLKRLATEEVGDLMHSGNSPKIRKQDLTY